MTNSTPNFTGRNVPIKEIAKATGKDPQFIRIGIQWQRLSKKWDMVREQMRSIVGG